MIRVVLQVRLSCMLPEIVADGLDTGTGPAVGTPHLSGRDQARADLGKTLPGKGKYNNSRQPVSCIRHPVFQKYLPPIFVSLYILYLGFMNNPGERLNFRCVQTCNKVTAAGLLVALGIIYGDIGTSPLYVFNSIIKDRVIDETLILGTLSLIIWTITMLTTVKYVVMVLRADNRGEGGIFSLFALVRRRKVAGDPGDDQGCCAAVGRYHYATDLHHVGY